MDGVSQPVRELTSVARHLRALAETCENFAAESRVSRPVLAAVIAESQISNRVRTYLSGRRKRDEILGGGWFEDPAWDILLDLLASQHEGRSVGISSACIAAAVPPTTALRWITSLEDARAVVRVRDVRDRRRSFLVLAPEVAERLEAWVFRYLPPAPSEGVEQG